MLRRRFFAERRDELVTKLFDKAGSMKGWKGHVYESLMVLRRSIFRYRGSDFRRFDDKGSGSRQLGFLAKRLLDDKIRAVR